MPRFQGLSRAPERVTIQVMDHSGGTGQICGADRGARIHPQHTALQPILAEPYRVFRRLQTLRDWSDETFKQILSGASGTGSAFGPGPPGRARHAMGGDRLGVVEGGLFARDATQVGSAGGTRPRSAIRATSEERERLKALERENLELRRANEILRKASAYFAQAELDRRPKS